MESKIGEVEISNYLKANDELSALLSINLIRSHKNACYELASNHKLSNFEEKQNVYDQCYSKLFSYSENFTKVISSIKI